MTSTSIFATSTTPTAEVARLVDNLDQFVSADGEVLAAQVAQAGISIKYSRAWLILRRAWLEANQKSALVTISVAKRNAAEKKFAATNPDWELRHVFGPEVVKLRMNDELSWGEISVRLGIPESKVRSAFKKAEGARKDVGLRIGKGGRFAYGDPTLYLEHRASEGAHIPVDYKGRPSVEVLLNAEKANS